MLKDCKSGTSIKAFNSKLQQDEYVEIKNIYHNSRPVYEVQLENGKTIRTSMEHKFLCDNGGMVALKDIVGSGLRILSL
jgi:intein/homing endonuclease